MQKMEIEIKKKEKVLDILCGNGFSFSYACKLLRNKDVKIDELRVKENVEVFPGSVVTVFYADGAKTENFSVVFEDENIIVVNKGKGIEVEGKEGLEGKIKGSTAVHRLDRNTEGLLVMAKNKFAEEELLKAIKERKIVKVYIAEVVGRADFNGEKLTAYLEKDSKNSFVKVFQNDKKGRQEIVTEFKTIKAGSETSLVKCTLHTGRTHQIRAHLAFLGHPIVGDGKYGINEVNKKFKAKSQSLICTHLKLEGLGRHLSYLNGKEFSITPKFMDNQKKVGK